MEQVRNELQFLFAHLQSYLVFPLNQPPWNYKVPLPKPENRDYIIEPDWDSLYV